MAHPASRNRALVRVLAAAAASGALAASLSALVLGLGACSLTDPPSVAGKGNLTPLGGGDAGPLTFNTSAAVTGAQDSHCGTTVQATSDSSCHPDGGGGGIVTPGGGYGATMYNSSGSDDNCKYDVTWASTTIVENKNAYLQVKVTKRTDQSPLTGAAPFAEIFKMVDNNPGPSLNGTQTATESKTTPGTYVVGPVQFDEAADGGKPATQGYWTVRLHFNETCSDVQPDSPHGHAAFYLNVP